MIKSHSFVKREIRLSYTKLHFWLSFSGNTGELLVAERTSCVSGKGGSCPEDYGDPFGLRAGCLSSQTLQRREMGHRPSRRPLTL